MSVGSLHTKYRPGSWGEIVGQADLVKSLQRVLKEGRAHSFLFVGPSGVGKTTIARIAAKDVGCDLRSIHEIDAATFAGIDSMRQVTAELQTKSLVGDSPNRAIILDECHALSKAAWQSLLKSIEEPPKHVYWFLCTTEAGKVPPTVKTRCVPYVLKLVSDKELRRLVVEVGNEEGLKLPPDVLDMIVREAHGSARQVLINLELCIGVTDKRKAADILRTALEGDAVLELCRYVVKGGGSWAKAMKLVEALEEENPESVRIVVVNYLASAIKGAQSDKAAIGLLNILDAFATPYNSSERTAPLLQSIGRALFSG